MILDIDYKLISLFEKYRDLKECFLFVTKEVDDIQLSQSTLYNLDQIEINRSIETTIGEVQVDELRGN